MSVDLLFGSQAEREVQYDARASVADFAGYMREYAERSEQVRARCAGVLDLHYGPGMAERLDIFLPAASAAPAPVLVFIHGGYWRAQRKEDMCSFVPAYTQAGIAVVVVEYTLVPEATLAEMVREMRSALAWIYQNAQHYGLDRERLFVSGSSAGGHLAAMLMAPGWPQRFGLPEDVVKGGVALSGLFDLRPLCQTVVNSWLQLSEAQAWELSPLRSIPARCGPLLLAVGGRETLGFHNQTQAMLQAWQQQGLGVAQIAAAECDHFSLLFELGRPESALCASTKALILDSTSVLTGVAPVPIRQPCCAASAEASDPAARPDQCR